MLLLEKSVYLFKRAHHKSIAHVLQSLDAELLHSHSCLFGGGTAIVLACGEYRESVDIDFLISDKRGYQAIRQLLVAKGIDAISRKGMQLQAAREIRADQYGLRTMLLTDLGEIKFEIVFEARIELAPSSQDQKICGVSTISRLDMGATKLLANSDRWSDDSVHSRDLIDLAMLGLKPQVLKEAMAKAEQAYGESIQRDLEKAVTTIAGRRGRLEVCMEALKITDVPKALLWKKIRGLVK